VKLRPAKRGVRAALRRVRSSSVADPWSEYLAVVEPALGARPRVHRFARPPVLGDGDTPPLPLAVWIDSKLDGDAATRTRAALERGTVAPSVLLDGPLQQALAGTRSERVMLVRAGDEPAVVALERLGQAAALAPDAAVITCDDDELSAAGGRHSPHFRPGPSPDHWLACDDCGPLLVVQRQRATAAMAELTDGDAWRHELALLLAGPGGQEHAHIPLLLCHRAAGVPAAPPLSTAAAARALHRWEPGAKIEQAGTARWVRRPPAGEPSVEVIVCFRDRPELLARSLVSVLARTHYEHLRLALVDNGSARQETEALLAGLARHPRVRVLRDPRPFNFAALNNAAATSSQAEVLVFLNNDTEVIDGDWLTVLLEEALRPEIGAVAPLLLYPDGTVQHAGAALGLHGYAGHPFAGLDPDAETPFGRATEGTRNWLAVTAACLMVERTKFMGVGGFDERFVVAGNDVDLCLRLTASGYRSVFVPHTRLVHDESRSRGTLIDPEDFAASERSYGAFRTTGDPFYNPNLTLRRTDCQVRSSDEQIS
jgi:O-antigen biosynthesis protein